MSIEDLIIIHRIEEDNMGFENKGADNLSEAKANFMAHGQGSKFKKANNKGKGCWNLNGESLRRRSSKGNASIVGRKVSNLCIADC